MKLKPVTATVHDWQLTGRAIPRNELEQIRVDRDAELDACVRHLNVHGQNAFLWGTRGVGKTFLLRLVEENLRTDNRILPVSVDVLGLPGFGRSNATTAFPEAVLLSICTTIWKDVLGKPYSELRARLNLRQGDLRLRSKLAKTVEEIYLHCMGSQKKAHYEYTNSVGFSAGATGEKKETGWAEHEQPPILPFEFMEFCEELLRVMEEHGKTRIIALCDEANLLPSCQQRDILARYIDLFASRSIQFLFVAGVPDWEPRPPFIPDGFDLILELKGLHANAAKQLLCNIAKRAGKELVPEAAEIAQEQLLGNPRMMIMALKSVVIDSPQTNTITSQALKSACDRIIEEQVRFRPTLRPQFKARKVRKVRS